MNLLVARNKLFRTVSRDEFAGLPRSEKIKLWGAACKQVGAKAVYTDRRSPTKSKTRRHPLNPKPRKSRTQLKRWAYKIYEEAEAKERAEADQRAFDRAPHTYFGSRW